MKKVLFLLLVAVLLAQYCDARSADSEDSELEVNNLDSLRSYNVAQFRELVTKTLTNGKKWLEDVHKEIDNMTQKDARTDDLDQQIVEIVTKLSELRRFDNEKSKYQEEMPRMFEYLNNENNQYQVMARLFEDIVRLAFQYDLSNVENSDPELQSNADLLTRNGMNVFYDEFVVDFEKCAAKVVSAMEQYLNSLSSTERHDQSKLVEWLRAFKTEQSFKQKFEDLLYL